MGLWSDFVNFFDPLVEFFDDFVDFFIDLIDMIIDAMNAIVEFIVDHWVEILIGIGIAAAIILAVLYGPQLIPILIDLASVEIGAVTFTFGQVAGMALWVDSFLTAIYFSTILAINQVVLLISPEYQKMWQAFMGQIAVVSSVLGLGASFITHALRNARTIVLDASSMLGMSYDMAEIQWLSNLSVFMIDFQKKIDTYKDDPNQVLWDIDQFLIKEAHNVRSGVMANVFSGLKGLADGAVVLLRDVNKVSDDLSRFVSQLPYFMRREIGPAINKVTDKINDFIQGTFTPRIGNINAILASLGYQQEATRTELTQLINSLVANLAHTESVRGETIKGEIRTTQMELEELGEVTDDRLFDMAAAVNMDIEELRAVLSGDMTAWADHFGVVLEEFEDTTSVKLNTLGEKLRLPGTFLQTVDQLSDADRLIQQDLIGEVSTRTFRDDMEVMVDSADASVKMMQERVEAARSAPPAPAILGFELEITRPYVIQRAELRNTWFVGDY